MTLATLLTLAEQGDATLLKPLDYVLIVLYLGGIVVMGSLFARGQKSSDDYFVAGRSMHWIPLALSIWASLTSANSMLGAPAYAYSQDLQQVPVAGLMGFISAVFVIYLILPLLHPLKLTTAYTYLEMRFNLPVRLFGSVLFILLRGGWLATVIYGPSLALSAVIPLPSIDAWLAPVAASCGVEHGSTIFWIVIVGVGATIYTTLGGLKAVIWTDVAQFIVFALGIVVIWLILLGNLGLDRMIDKLGEIPRAYAVEEQQVSWGQRVEMDGSLSRDFSATGLSYQWRQHDASDKLPRIQLNDANSSIAWFTAPQKPEEEGDPMTLTFALRVTTNDETPLQSPPTVVKIKVGNNASASPATPNPPAYHDRAHDRWFVFDFHWTTFFASGVTFLLLYSSSLLSRINDAGADQVALQRYFSAKSEAHSRRAIWLNAICDLPLMPMLFLTGAGVLLFYAVNHDPNLPLKPGQAMPYFVADQLNQWVPGLSGLFIAALFAATMSSVDSGINSIGATITTDFYRRLFKPNAPEIHYLGVARTTTLVLGLFATIAALFLGRIGEIWQVAVTLAGFWTGPLLGIFLLGFFTRRASSSGVIVGAIVGLLCTLWFKSEGGNEFFFSAVGMIPTMVIGYLISLASPPRKDQTNGLTWWTRHADRLLKG